jgi:hypothetical protein
MIKRGAMTLTSILLFAGVAQSEEKEPSAIVAIGIAGGSRDQAHVLAVAGTKNRLVSGTELQLLFR